MSRIGRLSVCFAAALTCAPAGASSVVFVQTDTSTQGNWKGVYGQDGNVIAQHSVLVPPYATLDTAGAINLNLLDIWATDAPALLKQFYSYSPTERVKSYFHTPSSMDFLLGALDTQTHRIALYFADYENQGRSVIVQGIDRATGVVLDSRPVSNYANGVYLVYNYSGPLIFRILNNNPATPTGAVTAFFWGGATTVVPPPPPAGDTMPPEVRIISPTPLTTVSGVVSLTAMASDNVGVNGVQYQLDGTNLGPLSTGPPYLFNWDTTGVSNGSHNLTAIASDAAGNHGEFTMSVFVSNTPVSTGNTAIFLGYDNSTAGNWKTVYGQDGNVIAQHSVQVPPYATFDTAGDINLSLVNLWSTSPLALLKEFYSYSPVERVESLFITHSSMDFRIGSRDALEHEIAVYGCNFDGVDRFTGLSVLDGVTGVTLATATSGFSHPLGCAYAVFRYTGQVIFRVTGPTAAGGAVSAFFWGGRVSPPGPAEEGSPAAKVILFSPVAGSTISGAVYLTTLAQGILLPTGVNFSVDGNPIGVAMTYPYSLFWNSASVPDGVHTLTASLTDGTGNTATMSITVNIHNRP